MSEAVDPEDPRLFIESKRAYVLGPIQTATEVASTDRSELFAERDAFKNFISCVRGLEPEPAIPGNQMPFSDSTHRSTEVRDAYQKTVLAVDHYEEVYNESLMDNAVAELGTDAAVVLSSDTDVTFTSAAKELLIRRARQRLQSRTGAIDTFAAELTSLEANEKDIRQIVEEMAGTVVPQWHREQFESAITTIHQQRQEHLRRQHGSHSGHEMCSYLYEEQIWQYPVLTSIARLYETTAI